MDRPGAAYDETTFARLVARFLGASSHVAVAKGGELAVAMPGLVWSMDQPVAGGGDAGFSYFAASRLASQYVKVGLTGHGGDELFAGYPAQFRTAFGRTDAFTASSEAPEPARTGTSAWARFGRVLVSEGLSGLVRRLRVRLQRPTHEVSEREWKWISSHCRSPLSLRLLLAPEARRALNVDGMIEDYIAPFREAPSDHVLDKCLYHDLKVYLPQLLHKEDRASMRVSMESRVPFLDHRIADFLGTLGPEERVPDMIPKGLLRKVASSVIPGEVAARRDKVPFAIPMKAWLEEELVPLVEELVTSDRCLDRGIFNPDLIRSGSMSSVDRLTVLNVELWHRLFVDGDPLWIERVGCGAGES
jgi:asparagine synthase (glutamine-hydrolysing)